MKKFDSTNLLTKLGTGLAFAFCLLFLRPLWAPAPPPDFNVGQDVQVQMKLPTYDIKIEEIFCRTVVLSDSGRRFVFLNVIVKNSGDKILEATNYFPNFLRISIYGNEPSSDPSASNFQSIPPDLSHLYLQSNTPILKQFLKSKLRQSILWFEAESGEPSNVYVKADVLFGGEEIKELESFRVDNSSSLDVTSPQQCIIETQN